MRPGAWSSERLVPLQAVERSGLELQGQRARVSALAADQFTLAPRGVGGLLDTAWEMLSARFLGCIGVALALTLPARATLIAVRYSGVQTMTRSGLEFALTQLEPLLIAVLMATMVQDHVAGRSSSPWVSVRATLDRLPSLIAVLVLLAIGQFLAGTAVLCCFPIGLFVSWQLSVAPAVYAIEGRSLTGVLPRGLRLLRGWGNFGRWLGWTVVLTIMLSGLYLSVGALEEPRFRAWVLEFTSLDSLTLDLIAALPAALFSAIASAFAAIVLTVYYFDVRVRREGLDLERSLLEFEQAHRSANSAAAKAPRDSAPQDSASSTSSASGGRK